MTDDKIQDLAEEYLDASGESLEDEISDLKESIENLQDEKEDYQELGNDNKLLREVKDEIEEKQEKLEELKQEEEDTENLEERFLQSIWNEFDVREIDEDTIKAVNLALTGKEKPYLLVDGNKIEPNTVSELEKAEARQCTFEVMRLAKDKLEGDEKVEETWDAISNSEKYEPFVHVANSNKPIDPSKVAEELGEKRETVRGRMKNPRYQQPLNPYHTESGNYILSIVGEYFWSEYASEDVDTEENEENEESIDTSEENTQTREEFWNEISN
jgi:vacuolar-type H+-ATPase subunit I/STV1